MHKIEKLRSKTESLKFLRAYEACTSCRQLKYVVGVRGALSWNATRQLEVRAGINNIVCEVEEKFEISSMVQKTLDRIVRKIKAFPNVQWCVQWGMDPFDFGKEAFNDHLQSLADESLYESCTLPTQLKI